MAHLCEFRKCRWTGAWAWSAPYCLTGPGTNAAWSLDSVTAALQQQRQEAVLSQQHVPEALSWFSNLKLEYGGTVLSDESPF